LKNREIAELFYKAAAILEYQQVEWKPRAYKKDAEKIENLGEDIEKLYERRGKDGLIEIPGVGISIADRIAEYLETGKVEKFKKLKGTAPSGASELMEIWGLGAKKLKKLTDALGIRTLSDLKNAILAHKIRELKDFGEKSEENLLKAVEHYEKSHDRASLGKVLPLAEELISALKAKCESKICKIDLSKIIYTGSLRRLKETIRDIDILAEAEREEALKIMDVFVSLPEVEHIILKGSTKSS